MKLLYRLTLILIFILITTVFIAFARGYRLDIEKRTIVPTGILSVNSNPKAAKIYIDGIFKGATNTNLTLPPGHYNVEIKKDGYTNWSKKVDLQGEIVLSLDALLFPINPSLSPLTNLGIVKITSINQTEKILLFSQAEDPEKDGIYLFDSDKKPLGLTQNLQPILLLKTFPYLEIDFKETQVYFSPDGAQAILEARTMSYLISLQEENKQLFDVTNSKATLLEAWQEEKTKQTLKILETFPKEISKIASDSFKIISFSPNENKILYQAKESAELPRIIKPALIGANPTVEERTLIKNSLYVYDKKEDKNFALKDERNDLITNYTDVYPLLWLTDSEHLVINEAFNIKTAINNRNSKLKKQLTIVDYDGINKQTVYSGPFEPEFFSVTNDDNLVILANLNPESNELPDLYKVGIK